MSQVMRAPHSELRSMTSAFQSILSDPLGDAQKDETNLFALPQGSLAKLSNAFLQLGSKEIGYVNQSLTGLGNIISFVPYRFRNHVLSV